MAVQIVDLPQKEAFQHGSQHGNRQRAQQNRQPELVRARCKGEKMALSMKSAVGKLVPGREAIDNPAAEPQAHRIGQADWSIEMISTQPLEKGGHRAHSPAALAYCQSERHNPGGYASRPTKQIL